MKSQVLSSSLKLSFCITCKNRLEQISKTLQINLDNNRLDQQIVEFILIDFESNDGLKEWVKDNFNDELKSGYLKFYYTNRLPYWHASIAKNTAHYHANNEIVVNLDCDNYTGYRGGLFVIKQFAQNEGYRIILHQFNQYGDGSYGRIAVLRRFFDEVGGYDESFEPMGYQDTDLLIRLNLLGLNYIRVNDKRYNQAERNSKTYSIINTCSQLTWEQMEGLNKVKSKENLNKGIICANNGNYGIRSDVVSL